MASSFSSEQRRRLRNLPRPAWASSISRRRSRGLEWTIESTRPWLIADTFPPEVGVGEEFDDVRQPAAGAVHPVAAVSVSIQRG